MAIEEFVGSDEIFYEENSILILKTKAKLLPHDFYTIFTTEATGLKKRAKNNEEHRRTRLTLMQI